MTDLDKTRPWPAHLVRELEAAERARPRGPEPSRMIVFDGEEFLLDRRTGTGPEDSIPGLDRRQPARRGLLRRIADYLRGHTQ